MFCKNCGKQLRENAGFCPYCGCKINIKEAETQKLNTVRQLKYTHFIYYIMTVIIMLMIIFFCCHFLLNKDKNKINFNSDTNEINFETTIVEPQGTNQSEYNSEVNLQANQSHDNNLDESVSMDITTSEQESGSSEYELFADSETTTELETTQMQTEMVCYDLLCQEFQYEMKLGDTDVDVLMEFFSDELYSEFKYNDGWEGLLKLEAIYKICISLGFDPNELIQIEPEGYSVEGYYLLKYSIKNGQMFIGVDTHNLVGYAEPPQIMFPSWKRIYLEWMENDMLSESIACDTDYTMWEYELIDRGDYSPILVIHTGEGQGAFDREYYEIIDNKVCNIMSYSWIGGGCSDEYYFIKNSKYVVNKVSSPDIGGGEWENYSLRIYQAGKDGMKREAKLWWGTNENPKEGNNYSFVYMGSSDSEISGTAFATLVDAALGEGATAELENQLMGNTNTTHVIEYAEVLGKYSWEEIISYLCKYD